MGGDWQNWPPITAPYFLTSPGNQQALGRGGGIAAAAAPALRETAGREGGSWGDNPPPFLPPWAQPPTLTSSPSAGARTPPNPVAPLAPTPRQRQRHSHPPRPLRQTGWGGGQPPRLPTPLRWGQERAGRRRVEVAKRDVEERVGDRLGLGGRTGKRVAEKRMRAHWGEGCWGKERGPEREKGWKDKRRARRRPRKFGMGMWTGHPGEGVPAPSPIPFLALWPHMTLGQLC